MAIIKAGTYELNHTLDFSNIESTITEENFVFTFVQGDISAKNIRVGINSLDVTAFVAEESGDRIISELTYDDNYNWINHSIGDLSFYGKTISVAIDTEVSTEFADWFATNFPEYKETAIIKAGTYRLIDNPTEYDGGEVIFENEAEEYILKASDKITMGDTECECLITHAFFLGNVIEYSVSAITPDGVFPIGNVAPYNATNGWSNTDGVSLDIYPIGFGRYFNFIEDFETDDTFGTWFTENTQMLIEAGTYRFNAELQPPTSIYAIEINFTYKFPANVDEAESFEDLIFDDVSCDIFLAQPTQIAFRYWNEGSAVAIPYYNFDGTFSYHDINNTITVTEDTYVPTNFGTWFTENSTEMVLVKAGTYRWNDELTIPSTDLSTSLTFSCDNQSGLGISTLVSVTQSYDLFIQYFFGTMDNLTVVNAYIDYPNESSAYPEDIVFYWQNSVYQTITITEDSYVSVDFYDWFVANTKARIKGVWKLNSTITLATLGSISLNWRLKDNLNYVQMQVTADGIWYYYSQRDLLGDYTSSFQVYSASATMAESYRRIAFVGEQTVPYKFYEWFAANAVDITRKITSVNYGAEQIAVLEDGEKVTLSCAGLPMTNDVTILAHSAPTLIAKEVTKNGKYFARDDGANGYSAVTVNVPIPDGYVIPEGEINITMNGEHNISGKATAIINVPTSYTFYTINSLPADAPDGSLAIILGGE